MSSVVTVAEEIMCPLYCFCSSHPTVNVRKIMRDDSSDGQHGSVKSVRADFDLEQIFPSSQQLQHAC